MDIKVEHLINGIFDGIKFVDDTNRNFVDIQTYTQDLKATLVECRDVMETFKV